MHTTQVREVVLNAYAKLDVGEIALAKWPEIPVVVAVPAGSEVPKFLTVTVVVQIASPRPDEQLTYAGSIERVGKDRWRWTGIPEGSHQATVAATGFASQEMAIEVHKGNKTPLRIVLQRP